MQMPVIIRHELLEVHTRRIGAAMHMLMIAADLLLEIQAQRIRAAKRGFAHRGQHERKHGESDQKFHGRCGSLQKR